MTVAANTDRDLPEDITTADAEPDDAAAGEDFDDDARPDPEAEHDDPGPHGTGPALDDADEGSGGHAPDSEVGR